MAADIGAPSRAHASWDEARRADPSRDALDDAGQAIMDLGSAAAGIASEIPDAVAQIGPRAFEGLDSTGKYLLGVDRTLGEGGEWSQIFQNYGLESNPVTRAAEIANHFVYGTIDLATGHIPGMIFNEALGLDVPYFRPPPTTPKAAAEDLVGATLLFAGARAAFAKGTNPSAARAPHAEAAPATPPKATPRAEPARVRTLQARPARARHAQHPHVTRPRREATPMIDSALPSEVRGLSSRASTLDLADVPNPEMTSRIVWRNGGESRATRIQNGSTVRVEVEGMPRGDVVTFDFNPATRTVTVGDMSANGTIVTIDGMQTFVKEGLRDIPVSGRATSLQVDVGGTTHTVYIPSAKAM